MVPPTSKNWVITGTDKGFDGLELREAKIPELGENEVLVCSQVVDERKTS